MEQKEENRGLLKLYRACVTIIFPREVLSGYFGYSFSTKHLFQILASNNIGKWGGD